MHEGAVTQEQAAKAGLAADLLDARARSLALVSDLDGAQWLGPRLAIVNQMLWEVGHLAWFQEWWILRHARGQAPLYPHADALYDSARVAHDTRWDLPLFPRQEVLDWLARVLERAVACAGAPPDETGYFHRLATYHEDMHGEAFAYTRQTLGYPAPAFGAPAFGAPAFGALAFGAPGFGAPGFAPRPTAATSGAGPLPGDASIAGGTFLLGAERGGPFVFDNEKWAHEVEVRPFRIARAPVTNAELAAFTDAGGYRDRRLWSDAGWSWRSAAGAEHPVYWRRGDGGWLERRYNLELPLAPHHPAVHLCWFEAEAFCRWAGRRLPSEAEWELAASGLEKRRFPWGDAPPDARLANLDGLAGGPVDVAEHPAGDSPFGCRQMIGNTWEWTSTRFAPYPGFIADPYKEYSEPWFSTPHYVLRGGCWVTRARLLRNSWRNFYPPDRRDVFAGFRTCAVD